MNFSAKGLSVVSLNLTSVKCFLPVYQVVKCYEHNHDEVMLNDTSDTQNKKIERLRENKREKHGPIYCQRFALLNVHRCCACGLPVLAGSL